MAESTGLEASSARPTGRSIAHYLLVLAVVALVPAFVFSAILLQRNNEAQQRIVSALSTTTTQAIASAVTRQIDGNVTTLRVLATSLSLNSGNLSGFYDSATAALAGSGAYVFVMDEDLRPLVNTRVPYGSPLPDLVDEVAPRAALETGRYAISDVVFGPLAQSWVFSIHMPLPSVRAGPARVLAMTQQAETLVDALTSRELPELWHVAVVGGRGNTVAASTGAGLDPGTPFPLDIDRAASLQGQWQTVDNQGERSTALFWNVGGSDWIVVAWASEGAVRGPYAEAFWSLAIGGALLAAVVALIIYRVSVQIGRSVRGLEDEARLLGSGEAAPRRDYPISEISAISESIADASRRRKAAELEVRLLMRELAHRSKNQMTVIAAMAKQSAKTVDSVPEFVSSFERRIHGLARSTDLLLAHGIAGVGLRDVLVRQIDPLCPTDGGRVRIEGPELTLNTQSAQLLGMAAHELATNALKYGAFASDAGTLEVTWSATEEALHLNWRERGARLDALPERRGFGTTVIENMVARSLGATVTRTLHQDGIEWDFVIPAGSLDLHAVVPDAHGDTEAGPEASAGGRGSGAGGEN